MSERISLFRSTVARPDPAAPDQWLLMNRPDKGYGERAYGPFPSLDAIARRFAVRIGERGEDKHGVFVHMNVEPRARS